MIQDRRHSGDLPGKRGRITRVTAIMGGAALDVPTRTRGALAAMKA
jgi:hypothetical protein